jgi:sortase A
MTGSGNGGGMRYTGAEPDDGDFPPLGIFRRLVREAGLALIVLGLIVLLFVAYQLLGTNLTEQRNQSRLRQSFEQAVAARSATTTATPTTTAGSATTIPGSATTIPGSATTASAPTTTAVSATAVAGNGDVPTVGQPDAGTTSSAIPTGTAIAHLVIPAIGVDKYVVQGTTQDDLSEGPGHYPETVLPGQIGNSAIAGHRTTYGAPFFRLDNLHTGADIYITDTSGKRYTYQVTSSKVVSPNDVSVLDPSTTAELTLTTCNPRFSATSRLVVVAKLLGGKPPTKPTPTTTVPGTPSTTTPGATTPDHGALAALNLGQGDQSARTPAIAYGALVVLLWILTRLVIHHTRRWRRSAAYVIGIALCLIPLWFCFENVVRLLPPNI